MKKGLLLLGALVATTLLSYAQSAKFQIDLWMDDGDERILLGYEEDNPCRDQEKTLAQRYAREVRENPVLKAIGMGDAEKDIPECFEDGFANAYSEYFEYRIVSVSDRVKRFLHRTAGFGQVRELVFTILSDAVCDLCRLYPGDFKAEVVRLVKKEMAFVSTMNWHSYGVDKDGVLLVDGKPDYETPYSMDGFFIRRVINDGIQVRELATYLERLLAKLEAVDVSENGDIMRRVRINRELSYCTGLKGSYYMANATGDIFFPYKESPAERSLIQCIGDEGSRMYKISNGYLKTDPDYEWVLFERPDDRQVILVDHAGSTIFRE